jgi:hypothetical protein
MKGKQLTMAEITPEYEEFVEKFKVKKTTDDCYTPDNVFSVIVQWVVDEYGIDEEKIVRPFWPGGDYENFEYPDDCVVLDNPPFSIISKIVRFYEENGIKYFLFCPSLTSFNIRAKSTIITSAQIIYENGAKVNTSFVTSLDDSFLRTAPSLKKIIEAANEGNKKKATLPKYEYPANVLTAAMCGNLVKYGIEFRVDRKDAVYVSTLDSQKAKNKTIFGGGCLLSETAAAEKTAAEKAAAEKIATEKWELSDREKQIIADLGRIE